MPRALHLMPSVLSCGLLHLLLDQQSNCSSCSSPGSSICLRFAVMVCVRCTHAQTPSHTGTHTDTNVLFYSLQFGVWIAYALVAYCYFGVGFAGYHAFGSKTGSQIMYSLGHPIWVICVAEIMIIIHVCGSFQVRHPCDHM